MSLPAHQQAAIDLMNDNHNASQQIARLITVVSDQDAEIKRLREEREQVHVLFKDISAKMKKVDAGVRLLQEENALLKEQLAEKTETINILDNLVNDLHRRHGELAQQLSDTVNKRNNLLKTVTDFHRRMNYMANYGLDVMSFTRADREELERLMKDSAP